MSRYHSYLNTASTILLKYKGEEPFASFLKKYFAASKKYGSKDRKQISHLCYCFFRMGKMKLNGPADEQILAALFLCSNEPDELLENLKPEWNERAPGTTNEKCRLINARGSAADVFPWKDKLSSGIDHEKFCESFFVQPYLFLRIRPGHEETVKKKLDGANLPFEALSPNCIALANASKIDSIVQVNKEVVVQDYNSQNVARLMALVKPTPEKAWDCCAASGGKSIMLHDLYPAIDLTVTDVRESILSNLKKRFREAEISGYKSGVIDLSDSRHPLPISSFGFIIADVPCTGSGTWGRTPEQLYYFEERKIDEYAALQERIVSNIVPHLGPGGFLLYITCSVFKKENEDMAAFIQQKFNLQLIKMEVLRGYDKKADTLFAALFQKPL